MWPDCAVAHEPWLQKRPSALTHGDHAFKKVPVQFRAWAISTNGLAQEPWLKRGPSAPPHRGHDFTEALVRSRTGARILMRPQCGSAQGHDFQAAAM